MSLTQKDVHKLQQLGVQLAAILKSTSVEISNGKVQLIRMGKVVDSKPLGLRSVAVSRTIVGR